MHRIGYYDGDGVNYDLVTVGGGLAGAALAMQMAQGGYRVLVLERETHFRDRVRGEQMFPWGIAEARSLGIYEPLAQTCGHHVPWRITYQNGVAVDRRDYTTGPHKAGFFHFYHPAMQEALLSLAEQAGSTVRRGAVVDAVIPGDAPEVRFSRNGAPQETVSTRLVVGADGRNSQVRRWGGFTVQHEPDFLEIAGVMFDSSSVPDNAWHIVPSQDIAVAFAPQGNERSRAYVVTRKADGGPPLSGNAHVPDFIAACRAAGTPDEFLSHVEPAGPLAEFNCADHWVEHPARAGVALIGDAAAASDPYMGCGTSLSLKDARHLRDCLLTTDDWQNAADQYAEQHDDYYSAVHRLIKWQRELFWSVGATADARRARYFERAKAEPERDPNLIGIGPASPSDESVRRFLLEE